jgi:hypothetical protein
MPVIQPGQPTYPTQAVPTHQTPNAPTQMFWPTPQAPYFEPHEGEGIGERLAKNAALAMGASLFETLGSFFRTWRWPKGSGN